MNQRANRESCITTAMLTHLGQQELFGLPINLDSYPTIKEQQKVANSRRTGIWGSTVKQH